MNQLMVRGHAQGTWKLAQFGHWLLYAAIVVTLLAVSDAALAQSSGAGMINFPIVDQVLCGFIQYSRSRLAPLIAVIVVAFAVIGHWLGEGRMWSALMYAGLGLGVILGIGSIVSRMEGVSLGSACF